MRSSGGDADRRRIMTVGPGGIFAWKQIWKFHFWKIWKFRFWIF
jgi:hypothetical protein